MVCIQNAIWMNLKWLYQVWTSNPIITYENTGWILLHDWLGVDVIAPKNIHFVSVKEAKEFVWDLGLKTSINWTLCNSKSKRNL